MKSPNLENIESESEIDKILDDFADVLFDMWLEENNSKQKSVTIIENE